MPEIKVGIQDIERARVVLRKHLEPTPLLKNRWLSQKYGCDLYLKLENMQPIGSFKIRGATYKIANLSLKEKRKGVIAASAGNHAQGVAWGSLQFGIKATIVMPKTAPLTKILQTQALKANVILEGANYDEAYLAAKKIARKTGLTFVHPYEDYYVVSGQGTAGLEILDQLPDVDVIIGSLGGGGLMAGVGTAVKAVRPKTKIIGVQPSGARSLVESIRRRRLVETHRAETFADGTKVVHASHTMLSLLRKVLDRTAVASDEEIASAVLMLMEKAKTLSEGSGAVPLAALEHLRRDIKGKKVVLIVSGGNIDVNLLSRIIDRGLILSHRRLRLNVWIKDKPGSLFRLTELIAKHNSNIIQAIHDREAPTAALDETGVELTLETRGAAHSRDLIKTLREHVVRLEVI